MPYHYCVSTAYSLPSLWYYREILPIHTVITTVTPVLSHSPLLCHSLIYIQYLDGPQIRGLIIAFLCAQLSSLSLTAELRLCRMGHLHIVWLLTHCWYLKCMI